MGKPAPGRAGAGMPGQDQLCSGTAGATAGWILPQLLLPTWGF